MVVSVYSMPTISSLADFRINDASKQYTCLWVLLAGEMGNILDIIVKAGFTRFRVSVPKLVHNRQTGLVSTKKQDS